MGPKVLRVFIFLLALSFSVPMSAAVAPTPPLPMLEVRYHYGDNAAWADPNFDDRSWAVAPKGLWAIPPFHSDGTIWVRFSVPVSPSSARGSSLWLVSPHAASEQVFLDGIQIGRSGELPPKPLAVVLPSFSVLDAVGSTRQASVARVALRLWYPPTLRYSGGEDRVTCELGSTAVLKERQRADRLAIILSWVPVLFLNALLALAGVGLLGLSFWSRRRELLWFSLLLVLYPLQLWIFALPAFTADPLSSHLVAELTVLGNSTTMFVTIEFLWIIFDLRNRWPRVLLHSAWIVFNAAELLASLATSSSSQIAWTMQIGLIALSVYNLGTLLIEVRFLVIGPHRTIAAGMAVIPVASSLGFLLHLHPTDLFGIPHLNLFDTGSLFAGAFLSVMLVRGALAASRHGARLRMELAAAREVQQSLVPTALPQIDRFQIEAAYLPAQEVGGDFYQVLPRNDGSTLFVIGDVSGKGLKAAMTGTLALGALRSLAQETLDPSPILARLNAQLAASSDGGFVTCLCVLTAMDGTLKLANAGHLAPYLNGEEIALDSGLPLGVDPFAKYAESSLTLAPGDRLTFVSDGIAEAQSPAGELFGFERTRQISTLPAEAIAREAHSFGQQDDITVLSFTFGEAESVHA